MAKIVSLKNQLTHLLSSIKDEFTEREGDKPSIAIRQKNSNFPAESTIDVLTEMGYTIMTHLKNPDFQLRFIINDVVDKDLMFDMELYHKGKKDESYFEEYVISGEDIPTIIKEWNDLVTSDNLHDDTRQITVKEFLATEEDPDDHGADEDADADEDIDTVSIHSADDSENIPDTETDSD